MKTTVKYLSLCSMLCAALLALPAKAEDAPAAQKVQPIYETEKGWSFDSDKNLVFYNDSANPNGTRFLRWKDYTWIVTEQKVVVVDSRPNGTRVQGLRHQLVDGNTIQSDKELMDALKKQAKEQRQERDPEQASNALPVNVGVGIGFGVGVGHRRHF